jgi:hypothetical protein
MSYSRAPGAVTHRRQPVVYRLLLRKSPDPPSLPWAGFEFSTLNSEFSILNSEFMEPFGRRDPPL